MYDILDFMLFMWLWLLYAWCEILVGLGFCCDLRFMVYYGKSDFSMGDLGGLRSL